MIVRSGESGADLALCDELADTDYIARRYAEVVIASGDHEFVPSVVRLKSARVRTIVASIPGQLNCVLRDVADAVIDLSLPVQGLALAA